ncbi:MAG: hypothetical protein WA882_19495 [Geitlerinemataceae cyanobacterium]
MGWAVEAGWVWTQLDLSRKGCSQAGRTCHTWDATIDLPPVVGSVNFNPF